MNLRQKTLLLVTVPFVVLLSLLYLILSERLRSNYAKIEEDSTKLNTERIHGALLSEFAQLTTNSADWAAWDDTYNFVQDGNQAYIDSNLEFDVLESLQINFLVLLNEEDDIVFEKGTGLGRGGQQDVPEQLLAHLSPGSLLVEHSATRSYHVGLLQIDNEVLMVVSRPIVRSNNSGPIRGTFFMGRFLDAAKMAEIEKRTRLDLDAYPYDALTASAQQQSTASSNSFDPSSSSDSPRSIPNLEQLQSQAFTLIAQESRFSQPEVANIDPLTTVEGSPIHTNPLNSEEIAGYTLLPDVYGNPTLLMQVTLPRKIHQQGQVSLRYLTLSLLGLGTLFILGLLLLLDKVILKRLTRLHAEVEDVGHDINFSLRVTAQGSDEISALGTAINRMLEALEISNCKLAEEQKKAERLLLHILPEPIANQLKQSQDSIAQHFDEVTILFADIVDFTPLSSRMQPIELVDVLNQIFSAFDQLADRFGLEKIKTIGDAYMVAAGLPQPQANHAEAIADMALAMQDAIQHIRCAHSQCFQLRIGINTGVVVAGVIGTKKFIYDLWGDAVNVASRMESSSKPGMIQVTQATYERLHAKGYRFEERGTIAVKGRGQMVTYWLKGKTHGLGLQTPVIPAPLSPPAPALTSTDNPVHSHPADVPPAEPTAATVAPTSRPDVPSRDARANDSTIEVPCAELDADEEILVVDADTETLDFMGAISPQH